MLLYCNFRGRESMVTISVQPWNYLSTLFFHFPEEVAQYNTTMHSN